MKGDEMDVVSDMGSPITDLVGVDLTFPQTPAATAALSVADRFYSPALLHHCFRSYLWAAKYAATHGIGFDEELLYVSAMLHDLGLTDAFDTHRAPFEESGGSLAWVFGVAAGWPAERAARAEEIIVLHMRPDVSAAEDPESHLLQVATSWDVAGRRPEEFPAELRAVILNRHPRQGFGGEFIAHFEDQARRKPDSAAAASIASNGAGRIRANPLDG
jgi:HD superfamily phosphodiesterase